MENLLNKNLNSDVANDKVHFINQFRFCELLHDIYDALYEINYALIKGEALSLLAYGKLGCRQSADIDILVPREYLRDIESVLISRGYLSTILPPAQRSTKIFCLSSSHQLPPLYKKTKGIHINVDINFDVFWGEYTGKRIDISSFLSDTYNIEIYGYKVKVLPPIKTMIHLVLHHFKELNSLYHLAKHNCIKHTLFQDVYYLWKNNQKAISLEQLYDLSHEYEIIPYVFYILFFTNQVFNDPVLSKYVEAFKTQEGIYLLDCYGLSNVERKKWKVDFETRLYSDSPYGLIKDDLSSSDLDKIARNRKLFG